MSTTTDTGAGPAPGSGPGNGAQRAGDGRTATGSGEGTGGPENGAQGATGTGPDVRPGSGAADRGGDGTEVGEGTDSGTDSGNAEAARFRRKLRETERERDGLREQVERMQRAEVDRLAGEHLAEPGDLLAIGGGTLADLLAESGDVDLGKVTTAVRALLDRRPGLARGRSFDRGAIGQGTPGAASGCGRSRWSEALRRR